MLPVRHEELLLWLVGRPVAKCHPKTQVEQVGTLDVRCAAAARALVAVSPSVAEVGVKMPQLDALIVASPGDSFSVAVVVH